MRGVCGRSAWLSILMLAASVWPAAAGLPGPTMLSPAAGESLAPGAIVEVRWTSLCTAAMRERLGRIDEAELVLSLDGGATYPIRVSHELSPCDTRSLWKVPMLATGRARLGVRIGQEGFVETETIAVVGPEFRILSDVDGRVQALYRRTSEWWTPLEPAVLNAEDLLQRAVSPVHGQLSGQEPPPDVAAPSDPAIEHLERAHASTRTAAPHDDPAGRPAAACRVGLQTPLRL